MTSSMTKLPAMAVQSLRIIFMFSSGSWGCYIQILASHGRTIRPKLHMLVLSNTRASFTKNAENR